MKNELTPSDEEIRSYMNFNSLLDKRKSVLQKNRRQAFLKWGVPLIMVTGLLTWFVIIKNTNEPPHEKVIPSIEGKRSNTLEALPGIHADSARAHVETEQVQNKKSSVNGQAAIETKSEKENKADMPTKEDIYVQAEPIDGYTNLYAYFAENLIYPADGLGDSIQGVQTVSFIINTSGQPESITITNSLGVPFEKEAKRLMENMPPWKPATLNGKPVPSKVAVPLTFQIDKTKR